MKQSNIEEKVTALYLRLSRDDEQSANGIGTGESNSISNQKALLTDFAKRNKFRNIKVFVDDGVSGVTMNRDGFKEMLTMVKADQVSTIIVKDMSRLGRNYLEVGQLTETVFPMHDVRFIAVNDGVDSDKGEDDFTPFRNIMNEWYAKDMSRKMRSTLRTKSKQGYAIGHPPLGYMYDTVDPKRWVIDPEGAEIVQHIYSLRQEGTSINEIALILKREKVLTPSLYAQQKGLKNPQKKATRGEYLWDHSMVRKILMNQAYVGDVINFRTYSKSFKLKDRLDNPKENWEIREDVFEPIIQLQYGRKYKNPSALRNTVSQRMSRKICLRDCFNAPIAAQISTTNTQTTIPITTTFLAETNARTTDYAVRPIIFALTMLRK
jgi:Site-specific recombinases, DNA invertase Pin homologs